MKSHQIIFWYELLPTTSGPQKFAKINVLKVENFNSFNIFGAKIEISGTNWVEKTFFTNLNLIPERFWTEYISLDFPLWEYRIASYLKLNCLKNLQKLTKGHLITKCPLFLADQSMKFSWKNIENWRSWKMSFLWV